MLDRPQFPDVVGDRKLLRFLRGHDHNVDKVCEMVTNFLTWRDDNSIDEIRERILRGGVTHPAKFPHGELILRMVPQVVIAFDACDKFGSPVCVEMYNFSPAAVMAKVSIPDYIEFTKHSLEYKYLIVEQLSEHKERADSSGAGVIVYTCVIRDLAGVGLEHVGSKGQEIIQAVISLASPNYPELMRKCFMINVPWVFNALWFFIKGLLPTRTVNKVDIMGSGFKDKIEQEIPRASLPKMIGGQHDGDADFAFDLAYFGAPLHFAHSCPSSSSAAAGGGGVVVEEVGGATVTLKSASTRADVAHPLAVSVVMAPPAGKTAAGAGAGAATPTPPVSEVPVPVPATAAYAVQTARFFSDAAAVARQEGSSSGSNLLRCAAATTVVDFDCGAGLLTCVLADILRQAPAGAHLRAVCCNEDISSGTFELLGKNVSRANAGATAAAPALVSVHEYAAAAAAATGTGHDACPPELVAGADAVVLRFETFARARAADAALDNLKHFVGSLVAAAPGVATLVLAMHVKAARLFAAPDQPSAAGAATVAEAFKAALPAALAAQVRLVTAPDNRTHFVVASSSPTAASVTAAAAATGDAPVPFSLAVGGKVV